MNIEIRQLSGNEEYLACVRLQEETWGENFAERVPASILMVNQKIGGVSAGAFDEHGRLVGFVFGMTGIKDGKPVHWSDMLAVRPEYRDQGLGRRLKLFQRDYVLALGVETIYWTYDPLVARNAHLNLNKLGADIEEYVENMYPSEDSVLHRGLGMDRFIVAWHIRSEKVRRALEGKPVFSLQNPESFPVVNTRMSETGLPEPLADIPAFPDDRIVRVEIPEDIHHAKDLFPEAGRLWRKCTRDSFLHYFQNGYRVAGYYRDASSHRCFYVLQQS